MVTRVFTIVKFASRLHGGRTRIRRRKVGLGDLQKLPAQITNIGRNVIFERTLSSRFEAVNQVSINEFIKFFDSAVHLLTGHLIIADGLFIVTGPFCGIPVVQLLDGSLA